MTLQKIVYAIQNVLNNGPITDDYVYTNKLIEYYVHIVRARLLRQRAQKEGTLAVANYQSFCMPLEEGNFSDCLVDCNIPNECTLLRSKYRIPKPIVGRDGELIKVRTMDGRMIGRAPSTLYAFSEYLSSPTTIYYFLFDGYIYVVTDKNLKVILVSGIFDDPTEVTQYSICDPDNHIADSPCVPKEEQEYPFDEDLLPILHDMVLQKLFKLPIYDKENDARIRESVGNQSKGTT